jgi:hypothetical protein
MRYTNLRQICLSRVISQFIQLRKRQYTAVRQKYLIVGVFFFKSCHWTRTDTSQLYGVVTKNVSNCFSFGDLPLWEYCTVYIYGALLSGRYFNFFCMLEGLAMLFFLYLPDRNLAKDYSFHNMYDKHTRYCGTAEIFNCLRSYKQ